MQKISELSNSQLNTYLYKQIGDESGKENPVFFVHDESGTQREPILHILGHGSHKTAFEIARGRALILPNIDDENVEEFAACWGRMVEEEVRISKLAQAAGLLSSRNKLVNISCSPNRSGGTVPTYICETFENLSKTKGWLVIDAKASNSSIWKKGTSFFSSQEDRLNPEKWDFVLDRLLTDIARFMRFVVPCEGDARNFAVIETMQGYQVRYFGFDFSDKNTSLKECNWGQDEKTIRKSAVTILSSMLEDILFVEFGWKYFDKQAHRTFANLKTQLLNELIPQCLSRCRIEEASDFKSDIHV